MVDCVDVRWSMLFGVKRENRRNQLHKRMDPLVFPVPAMISRLSLMVLIASDCSLFDTSSLFLVENGILLKRS